MTNRNKKIDIYKYKYNIWITIQTNNTLKIISFLKTKFIKTLLILKYDKDCKDFNH